MKLKELIADLGGVEVRGELPLEITGIYNDSRKMEAGGLFFAVSGSLFDGHKFIKSAKDNGAVVAIVERFTDDDIAQIKLDNVRGAMSKLAAKFYAYPASSFQLVGITATNGKTSTAFMLDNIVKAAEKKRAIIGTVMTEFEGFKTASILTTPDALELQSNFAKMREKDVEIATMEVSSIGIEQSRVHLPDFDVVTLNNISPEHTDQHGSFEQYVKAKQSLIKRAKPESFAVLNLDDAYSAELVQQTKAQTITYGYQEQNGDLVVKDFDMKTGYPEFTIVMNRDIESLNRTYPKTEFKIKLNIAGFHSVINSLAAVGAAIALGLPKEAIEQGLANYQGVERRCEMIYNRDFKIIDDHFANAGNIDVTLKTLSLIDYEKIVFVYAIRGSRGVTTNRENAEKIVEWSKELGIKKLYLSLSKSLVTYKDEVTADEQAVVEEILTEAGIEYTIYDELDTAIASGLDAVENNDILLLAGCQGMDCGGHIALKMLAERGADKTDLFAPLKDRVCCNLTL